MIDKWIEKLKLGKCIHDRDVKILCEKVIFYLFKVRELFVEESNVQPISSPVVVCGDIHGQLYDLLELFNKGGDIENTKYLFLGDYVDRGYNSVETIELLLCFKLKYPENITLIRGNHESRQVSYMYGFYEEIMRKYGNTNTWRYFTDLFDYFPLGAIIDGKIMCIHGGLSPQISTVDQIRLIHRKIEIPNEGPFTDLLWSDPEDIENWIMSNRGAGWIFGWRVVKEVSNKINLV